jgi:hypothetical protein
LFSTKASSGVAFRLPTLGRIVLPRDTSARQRIADYLANNGSIQDRSGRASGLLKEAIDYQGGDAGFHQLISSMEKAGELRREIRGRRTYRISAVSGSKPTTTHAAPTSNSGTSELDYEELAATLLARVAQVLSSSQGSADPASWARRRIEQLETRVDELQRELARARAEAKMNADERDELRGRLDAASHNLELLAERVDTNRNRPARAAERLGSDEQALLYELRGNRGGSGNRPDRAV